VAETEPEACTECGSSDLRRDPDVLDTWFSSALWPFATLGWPEDTPDLATFYPGNVSVTAREIIRLWENRMIFSGLELLGDVPFTDVIITSTILAPDKRRMSKSLGTGIDPREVISQYGADATRYGLLKMSSTQDVAFSYGAIEEGRKLANKLWNVSRLLLQAAAAEVAPEQRPQALEERWIAARLDAAQAQIQDGLESFNFAAVATALYRVTFDDFCDWYAEAIKPRIYAGDADAKATSLANLERLLKLLHPVMPHVSEEIWSQFHDDRLIVAPWPEGEGTLANPDADFDPIRTAAELFRRAGVRVPLNEEQTRIFEAVVKPDRATVNGDAAAEIARLEKEVARAEKMLANERFVENAAPDVVEAERDKLARYRRELDALSN
jgi:valyl-tRNA synthetase